MVLILETHTILPNLKVVRVEFLASDNKMMIYVHMYHTFSKKFSACSKVCVKCVICLDELEKDLKVLFVYFFQVNITHEASMNTKKLKSEGCIKNFWNFRLMKP